MTVFGKWLMATSVRRGKVASSLPSHARDWDGPLRGERLRPSTCVDKYTLMSLSWKRTLSPKLESHRHRGMPSFSWNSIVNLESHRYSGITSYTGITSLQWNLICIVESQRFLRLRSMTSFSLFHLIFTSFLYSNKSNITKIKSNNARFFFLILTRTDCCSFCLIATTTTSTTITTSSITTT